MMELAEFTVEDGTAVIFEVAQDEALRGTTPASRRGDALVVETGKRLEQVWRSCVPLWAPLDLR
jgi:hypothetical protein